MENIYCNVWFYSNWSFLWFNFWGLLYVYSYTETYTHMHTLVVLYGICICSELHTETDWEGAECKLNWILFTMTFPRSLVTGNTNVNNINTCKISVDINDD